MPQTWKSNFPVLESLSLDGVSNPAGLLSITSLERVFPRLKTLEVKGLRGALAFAREVARAVEDLEGREEDNPSSLRPELGKHPRISVSSLPRSLHSLSLHLLPEPRMQYSKRRYTMRVEILRVLRPLTHRVHTKGNSGLKVLVVDSETGCCGCQMVQLIPNPLAVCDSPVPSVQAAVAA